MNILPAVTALDDPVAPAFERSEQTQDVDVQPAPQVQLRRSRWSTVADPARSRPIVILAVLRVSPYFRQNNGDPFIYAGYANDFHGHVVRFSYTYYAVRWGLIFPMRAALAFGPVWGYFILRYVLYQVAIVPLYFALRPWGRRVALFGVVVFVANPVTAQAILSTYHDSIAVPVLTAVCRACSSSRSAAAPVLVWRRAPLPASSSASHQRQPVRPPARRDRNARASAHCCSASASVRDVLLGGAAFVAGMVAVSLVGMLAYDVMFDDPNIYATSLRALDEIDGDTTWRSPSPVWLHHRWYVYAPVVAIALAARRAVPAEHVMDGDGRRSSSPLGIASASLGLVRACTSSLLGGYPMEHAYYFSYVIGRSASSSAPRPASSPGSSRPLHPLVVLSPRPRWHGSRSRSRSRTSVCSP